MKMLTKVGEILEKYMGACTKGACVIVYNKYIPLNIYIYMFDNYLQTFLTTLDNYTAVLWHARIKFNYKREQQ